MSNAAIFDSGKLTITVDGATAAFNVSKPPAFVVARKGGPLGVSFTRHASFDAAFKARAQRGDGGDVLTVFER